MPLWNVSEAAASDPVHVKLVESLPSIFEEEVQEALNTLTADGARIISVSHHPGDGNQIKPTALITYSPAAEPSS